MYEVVETEMSWYDARTNCISKGGELASWHTSEEHSKAIVGTGVSKHYWVGLFKNEAYNWVWTDESNTGWLKWGSGYPKDNVGTCAHISSAVSDGALYNSQCFYTNKGSICKISNG